MKKPLSVSFYVQVIWWLYYIKDISIVKEVLMIRKAIEHSFA